MAGWSLPKLRSFPVGKAASVHYFLSFPTSLSSTHNNNAFLYFVTNSFAHPSNHCLSIVQKQRCPPRQTVSAMDVSAFEAAASNEGGVDLVKLFESLPPVVQDAVSLLAAKLA